MLRRLAALAVAGVTSLFAVLLLTGRYAAEGPILLRLGEGHGVHTGDLLVLAGWAVALLSVIGLLRGAGRGNG